jgi:hypothetical protein
MRPEGAAVEAGRVVGPVGMWESRGRRFPSAVEIEGKPPFGFPRFPPRVISTGLLRRRRRLRSPACPTLTDLDIPGSLGSEPQETS